MALEGNLSHFSVPDIIQVIGMSKRTGALHFARKKTKGVVYFENGMPIHASYGELSGEDAAYVFFGWVAGTFRFQEAARSTNQHSINISWTNLILEGSRHIDEWERIRSKVPNMDLIFELVPNKHIEDLTLSPTEWDVLYALNGKLSAREVAVARDYSEIETAKILYELYCAGLIIKKELPQKQALSETGVILRQFSDNIEKILGNSGAMIVLRLNETDVKSRAEVNKIIIKVRSYIKLFISPEVAERVHKRLVQLLAESSL